MVDSASGSGSSEPPFSWDQFLVLAEGLVSLGSEASLRSAISRAYYAAFHAARAHLQDVYALKTAEGGKGSHDVVWQELKKQGRHKVEQRAGDIGFGLKLKRTRADYDRVYLGRLKEEAEDSLEVAGRAIKLLRERAAAKANRAAP